MRRALQVTCRSVLQTWRHARRKPEQSGARLRRFMSSIIRCRRGVVGRGEEVMVNAPELKVKDGKPPS